MGSKNNPLGDEYRLKSSAGNQIAFGKLIETNLPTHAWLSLTRFVGSEESNREDHTENNQMSETSCVIAIINEAGLK